VLQDIISQAAHVLQTTTALWALDSNQELDALPVRRTVEFARRQQPAPFAKTVIILTQPLSLALRHAQMVTTEI